MRRAPFVMLVLGLVTAPLTALVPTPAQAAPATTSSVTRIPTTYAELPEGAPTTLPWWQRGTLHLGDTVIETRRNDLASRNGTTVAAPSLDRRLGGPAYWKLVVGRRLLPLPMKARADQPMISADGRWIAWLEVRAEPSDGYWRTERLRVVLYDVEDHEVARVLRNRRRVNEEGGNGIDLRTLSNRGRLVLGQGDDVRVLSPWGRVASFAGPLVDLGNQPDGWPGGTTVYRWRSERSDLGTVGRDGRFGPVASLSVPPSGLWNADGTGYAVTDDERGVQTHTVHALDGTGVTLQLPSEGVDFRVVGWESADAVVLWARDDGSMLMRCSATTGACERVPDGPRPGVAASMPSLN